jgi:putative membrane protein
VNQPSTSTDSTGIQPKSANELAEERTDLALERTLMAADRSLMAWVRTALSMISFGFTIYKLLDAFQEKGGDLSRAQSPRAMGLFLTGLGTVAMVMGVLEYWYRLKGLRQLGQFRIIQPTLIMAAIMSFTGLFMFIGIVSKLV